MEEYSNVSRIVRRSLGKIFKEEEEINSFNSTPQKSYFFYNVYTYQS
jgi:hypothetical protein